MVLEALAYLKIALGALMVLLALWQWHKGARYFLPVGVFLLIVGGGELLSVDVTVLQVLPVLFLVGWVSLGGASLSASSRRYALAAAAAGVGTAVCIFLIEVLWLTGGPTTSGVIQKLLVALAAMFTLGFLVLCFRSVQVSVRRPTER